MEIITDKNAESKLTVAKGRTTLKVATRDKRHLDRLIKFSERIEIELGDVEFTYRGQFWISSEAIVMNIEMSNSVDKKLFIERI